MKEKKFCAKQSEKIEQKLQKPTTEAQKKNEKETCEILHPKSLSFVSQNHLS
jgi:hypothetical protein